MHVVMIAAENAALPGGKVGGVGDVLRDVPQALAKRGHQLTVLMPGYQFLPQLAAAQKINTVSVMFGSALEQVGLYEVPADNAQPGVRIVLFDHPFFGDGASHNIYHHDVHEPFATDARTFALFCHAACLALLTGAIPKADVLHLHDWHSACVLILRKWLPVYEPLKKIHTVYSIHNLSLQGIRPLGHNWSSLLQWFPGLAIDTELVADPRWPDCVNLMRSGIMLADRVHVVSPSYAEEILHPSKPELGLIRGEGLENDLLQAKADGRLFGILNGCDYEHVRQKAITHRQFLTASAQELTRWANDHFWIKAPLLQAQQRLNLWQQRTRKPPMVVASVGRMTDQKALLFTAELANGQSALDAMLDKLSNGLMIVLGSGDENYEQFFWQVMKRHDNFIFLNGFSEKLADMVYRYCDLFVMPSSFEPCGISQMLAMRAGVPCLVHKVGGLADTVDNLENGFSFEGEDIGQQAQALVATFAEVLQTQSSKLPLWNSICRNAASARFSWDVVAGQYEVELYGS